MERHSRRKIEPEASIHPDHFYRYNEGYKWFGYMSTQMNERIKSGDVPMPISLSDHGRARGWFGRSIIAWQREREEKAKAKPPTPEKKSKPKKAATTRKQAEA
jgi:hypothetical protein